MKSPGLQRDSEVARPDSSKGPEPMARTLSYEVVDALADRVPERLAEALTRKPTLLGEIAAACASQDHSNASSKLGLHPEGALCGVEDGGSVDHATRASRPD